MIKLGLFIEQTRAIGHVMLTWWYMLLFSWLIFFFFLISLLLFGVRKKRVRRRVVAEGTEHLYPSSSSSFQPSIKMIFRHGSFVWVFLIYILKSLGIFFFQFSWYIPFFAFPEQISLRTYFILLAIGSIDIHIHKKSCCKIQLHRNFIISIHILSFNLLCVHFLHFPCLVAEKLHANKLPLHKLRWFNCHSFKFLPELKQESENLYFSLIWMKPKSSKSHCLCFHFVWAAAVDLIL